MNGNHYNVKPYEDPPFMCVKKLHDNAVIPHRAHGTDAGLDVFTIENGCIHPDQDGIIRTGIALSIPQGWTAIVKEKSGRAVNDKLSVGACVIDSSYRGEILIHMFNHGEIPFTYKIGEKIVQLVVVPCWTGQPVEVDELDDTERGEGKFGSTGLTDKDAHEAMKNMAESAGESVADIINEANSAWQGDHADEVRKLEDTFVGPLSGGIPLGELNVIVGRASTQFTDEFLKEEREHLRTRGVNVPEPIKGELLGGGGHPPVDLTGEDLCPICGFNHKDCMVKFNIGDVQC